MSSMSTKESNNSQVNDLPPSIQYLIKSLSSYQNLTSELVQKLIIKTKINPLDLSPWLTYDHPITDSYGRKLVYDGGNFEIMVMSWLPGDFSAIHDHGFTQWGAVQSFGKAQHISYEFTNNFLKTKQEAWFMPNQVVKVNHDLIHQMGNPTDNYFPSLHVYGCDNRQGEITSNARIFDLWEGSIKYTDGGVFFCLAESQINGRCYGLQGDLNTKLRHHQQMLNRINKILQDSDFASYELQLKAELLKNKIQAIKEMSEDFFNYPQCETIS